VILPAVVEQHRDDAALLASNRLDVVEGPNATLAYLDRFDRRLMAHLDGLRLAGEEGWALCESGLETPSSGIVFAVTVRALQDRDEARLSRVFALVQAMPETRTGLLSAFEWVEPTRLRGTVANLLRDRGGFRRMVGVAACAVHRVDPGLMSGELFRDVDLSVRSRSLKAVGELGLPDLTTSCIGALTDEDEDCRSWSAWSAVLIGDRDRGLDALTRLGLLPGRDRARALRLALQVMDTSAAHGVLQQLARSPHSARWLIQGSGIVGDPAYVSWLIQKMRNLPVARVAGEAFSTIAGVHLGQAALDRPAPQGFEAGPNDDPAAPNVEMDPDDGLSWPDVAKIEKWWAANSSRFVPGTRYFMGAPVTRERCIEVLKSGYQRQRILAAQYLCLLQPGTQLFPTSAPAWRQQRSLAKMS